MSSNLAKAEEIVVSGLTGFRIFSMSDSLNLKDYPSFKLRYCFSSELALLLVNY